MFSKPSTFYKTTQNLHTF